MHELEVGELYHPGRTAWPEITQYNFRSGGHELLLIWTNPSPAEVGGVRKGPMELALVVVEEVILLLYRIKGAAKWSDAPYSWHRVPEDQQGELPVRPEEISEGQGAALQVILVQANGGQVRALRLVGLGTEFTRKLHEAIRDQAARDWDPESYDARLETLYRSFPRVEDLLERAVARYRVGRK